MMVGDEYTICPMCGGNDGQGCYGNCPSQEIPKLWAEIERLREVIIQYRDDLLYPPPAESIERRIRMIDAVLDGK